MKSYLTIDCGTTNTRIFLIEDGNITSSAALSVGARGCAENREDFTAALKSEIDAILSEKSLTQKDIEAIILSGMITSELGLCKVDHIKSPCGIKELKRGLVLCDVGIADIPCYFIPGIKTECLSLGTADMMRGEEAEIMGLIEEGDGECVYVLPGSHSKHIIVDSDGRISDLKTFMSGEMISALSKNTILKESVSLDFNGFVGEYLLLGYDFSKEYGISAALFKTRISDKLFGAADIERYSFFIGAVLESEISALTRYEKKKIKIGGKASLRNSMLYLLEKRSKLDVEGYDESETKYATARGAVKIYEFDGE